VTEEKKAKGKEMPVEMRTIEELAEKNNVPRWAMAGLKVARGWGAGKVVTEAEFLAALNSWLSGPMRREK